MHAMDSGMKLCPLCSTEHADTSCTLILKQVNATEAIYVCSNSECTYPVGEEVIVVKRTIMELLSDSDSQDDAAITSLSIQERNNDVQCNNSDHAISDSCVMYADSGTECKSSVSPPSLLPPPMDTIPEAWYDSLMDTDVCNWLDSQTS